MDDDLPRDSEGSIETSSVEPFDLYQNRLAGTVDRLPLSARWGNFAGGWRVDGTTVWVSRDATLPDSPVQVGDQVLASGERSSRRLFLASAIELLQPGRIPAQREPEFSEDGTGNFRTHCLESHINFDDPLVFPGQPGASHQHIFFGNPTTDAFTTIESLFTATTTTCEGDTLNRSAYWMPALLDQDGERLIYEEPLFYYKSGFHIPGEMIQAPPPGLKMIAGHAMATSPQSTETVKWRCESWQPTTPQFDEGDPLDHVPYIPNCELDDLVEMRIVFPQCWDGVNLDSPDHRSHMAYPIPAQVPNVGTGSCPASHPIAIPEISYNAAFYVTEETGRPSQWRLGSDSYEGGPGGYSTHGDWMNGWDPAIMDLIVENCINRSMDCGVGLLGDGTRLAPIPGMD